jgi:hypothetical protein
VVTDGEVIAEVGPGAILGEMALLDHGHRTATLRAMPLTHVVGSTERHCLLPAYLSYPAVTARRTGRRAQPAPQAAADVRARA